MNPGISTWSVGMKKLVIVLISGIFVFAMGSVQVPPETAQAKAMVKITGRVTDFEGRPVKGAAVELKSSRFENAAEGVSDKDGRYALTVPRGTYMALAAVKDYKVKSLEYWAWNVPAEQDLEINPRFDRLEVYGINAWRPQGGYPSYQIYFRPMSLTRTLKAVQDAGGMNNLGKLKVIDIAPELMADNIQVTIDGQPVRVFQLNKVREASGPNQYLFGYLIQVPLPETKPKTESFPITITLTDRTTGEKGEGCLYFRPARLL
jgi:hypothetical protein